MPEKAMLWMPVRFWMIWGRRVTSPRKRAPQRVRRETICSRNFTVGSPGRIPGMNPPYSRSDSAMRLGSNWTAV